MIALTGATGTVGSHLLRLLCDVDVPIRALSRRPPVGEGGSKVEWRKADLADRASLPAVLQDVDRLFLLTGNVEPMVRLQKNAIAAAAEAGVRRVVKLSALGASDHSTSVIGVWHHGIEHALRNSGLAWTILRPHVFMQNVLDQRTSIREEGAVRSPSADAAIPMIDARDIAAAARETLTGEGHEGKRYTLTGPEPISWRKATEILAEESGRSLRYVPEDEVEAFRRLHREGLPAWLIGARLALADYQRRGGGTDVVTDTVEELTGRAPRPFGAFARDHAPAVAGMS